MLQKAVCGACSWIGVHLIPATTFSIRAAANCPRHSNLWSKRYATSSQAEEDMKVDGACHCGAIAYEAEVKEGTVNICHCLDCQTLTGSAFRANIQAPADGFRLVRGSPRRYIKTAESGAQRLHAFCGDCGGPVFACDPERPKSYSLRVGALR